MEQEKDQESLEISNPAPIIALSKAQLENLLAVGMDVNCLFLLQAFENGEDIAFESGNLKMLSWRQTLLRKGYITEKRDISLSGREFLKAIREGEDVKVAKKQKLKEDSDFERWWKAYPGTDTFMIGMRTFKGNRSLKTKKDECQVKFEKIINEGEFTAQQLIDALELEVEQKKEASAMEGKNKLSYLQNSLTYLNNRTFEPFVELLKQKDLARTKYHIKNSIDI